MFEIFDPWDKSRCTFAIVASEALARLLVTVANRRRSREGLPLLDYAHESEPWLD